MSELVRFFICGSALRGEPDHGNLHGARLIKQERTAPYYRIHSVNDGHPAIYAVTHSGVSITGELYELTAEQHEALLAREAPDLYEDSVVLDDGSLARAMLYPRELVERHRHPDISQYGGWAAYRRSR
jgi:gamma-glutamylcyclotransferase (GGCT)/AIG2-like uncharacterized protein YtfP